MRNFVLTFAVSLIALISMGCQDNDANQVVTPEQVNSISKSEQEVEVIEEQVSDTFNQSGKIALDVIY